MATLASVNVLPSTTPRVLYIRTTASARFENASEISFDVTANFFILVGGVPQQDGFEITLSPHDAATSALPFGESGACAYAIPLGPSLVNTLVELVGEASFSDTDPAGGLNVVIIAPVDRPQQDNATLTVFEFLL